MRGTIGFSSARSGWQRLVTGFGAGLERLGVVSDLIGRQLATPGRQLAALLALGLVLRIATFGDTNLHVDETFYSVIGQEMHRGAVPYVDVWDRKPIGLFVIFYLLAGISTSVLSYQIAGWLFAALTAWVIARIAARWAGAQGAVLAGGAYLFMLGALEGGGAQSPIFYNLFIAGAVWLVLEARPALEAGRPDWRAAAAMLLAGLAMTIKQTTLFEGAALGLYCAWVIWQSPVRRGTALAVIGLWALIGAAPTLLSAAVYYRLGYWDPFWHAMFTSNLAKAKPHPVVMLVDAFEMALRLYPLLVIAWIGRQLEPVVTGFESYRGFMRVWIIAALLGVLAVPNFFEHYALPMLVPLAVLCARTLDRRDVGVFLFALVGIYSLTVFNPLNRFERVESIGHMERLTRLIRSHDSGGGLLVFDGPPYLYAQADKRPLSPLVFPHHFNQLAERNVSHLDTLAETKRLIAAQPGVIAAAAFPTNLPENAEVRALVLEYAFNQCRLVGVEPTVDMNGKLLIAVWGDCQRDKPYMRSF